MTARSTPGTDDCVCNYDCEKPVVCAYHTNEIARLTALWRALPTTDRKELREKMVNFERPWNATSIALGLLTVIGGDA